MEGGREEGSGVMSLEGVEWKKKRNRRSLEEKSVEKRECLEGVHRGTGVPEVVQQPAAGQCGANSQ